jgi:hypothetical protein
VRSPASLRRRGRICVGICYHFATQLPNIDPEGTSWFQAYPRIVQDQSVWDESSLGGIVRSELQIRCRSAWYSRATHVSWSEISPGLFWDLGPFPSALTPLRSKQSWITEYCGIQKPLVFLRRVLAIPAGFEPATHGVEKRKTRGIFPQSLKALVDVAAPGRGFFRDDTEKLPPGQRWAVAK